MKKQILSCILFFTGCNYTNSRDPSVIKAVLQDGTPVEFYFYAEPLPNDGFVINVHRPDDPIGKCWGTTIYPKKIKK